MEKTCKKCDETKPLDGFYKCKAARDGHEGMCRACRSAEANKRAKQRYYEDPEAHYQRTLKWRRENPERIARYNKKFREERPDVREAHTERRAQLHPEKVAASRAVRIAVQHEQLVKPDACEECGEERQPRELDGHHHDYSKPLEVEWLCRQCHVDRHAAEESRPQV